MRMLYGTCKIHDWKQIEHKSLYQRNKNTKSHDRQRRKKESGKSEKNGQNQFMSHHVSEKSESERQDACQMANDLNRKY